MIVRVCAIFHERIQRILTSSDGKDDDYETIDLRRALARQTCCLCPRLRPDPPSVDDGKDVCNCYERIQRILTHSDGKDDGNEPTDLSKALARQTSSLCPSLRLDPPSVDDGKDVCKMP